MIKRMTAKFNGRDAITRADTQKELSNWCQNYTENDYINAGFKFEKRRISAETLRHMIESEKIDERARARELIEKGRQEARKN